MTTSKSVSVQPNDDADRLMNTTEAAAFLRMSVFFVRDHMRHCAPFIPFVKVGYRVRFQRRDLLAFIESLKGKS